MDLGAIKDRVAKRCQQFPLDQAVIADLDELIAEVERYRELSVRLTLGAGPYAGQPLLGGGRTPDYLGSGVGALGGHYCLWCGVIREAADRHSADGVPHAVACRALNLSESWFYKWRDRPPTKCQQRRVSLDATVAEVFAESGGIPETYGSPRVYQGGGDRPVL